jgi:hypothetical protein
MSSNLAAVRWNNGKVYFFSGTHYLTYDMATDRVDKLWTPIRTDWPDLAGFFPNGVDAAVMWPNGRAYFFQGNRYVRYTVGVGIDPGYPKPIMKAWPGLGEAFPESIDAAVVWPTGDAYFFKGSQYVKYVVGPAGEGVAVGYPKPIFQNWPGLGPQVFLDGIDAVVVWPGDTDAYFFRGSFYAKYAISVNNPGAEGVYPGYPRPIQGSWSQFDPDIRDVLYREQAFGAVAEVPPLGTGVLWKKRITQELHGSNEILSLVGKRPKDGLAVAAICATQDVPW